MVQHIIVKICSGKISCQDFIQYIICFNTLNGQCEQIQRYWYMAIILLYNVNGCTFTSLLTDLVWPGLLYRHLHPFIHSFNKLFILLCHVSGVLCQLSSVTIFIYFLTVVELVGEGSVINPI